MCKRMARREMIAGLFASAIAGPLALLRFKSAKSSPVSTIVDERCEKCDRTFHVITSSDRPFQKQYLGNLDEVMRHCDECLGTPGQLANRFAPNLPVPKTV